MPSEPEFAELRTPAERLRIFIICLLTGILVTYLSKTWLFPSINEFAASAPCRKVLGIEGLTVLWYGLFVGVPLHGAILIAAVMGWRGYKILRDGQYPPLKEKVYKPTRILRGAPAKFKGYMHLLAPLPLLAMSIWGIFQAEEYSKTMRPKASTCAAATVNPPSATDDSPIFSPIDSPDNSPVAAAVAKVLT